MKGKRFIRLFSALLSVLLLISIGNYPASAKYFSDTYVGMLDREFFDAINYVSDNGLMGGTDSTHFSPYTEITRGMFVTVLYRYSGSTEQYSCNFTDVPASTYYYFPIGWANHYGIVNGVTETTFAPDQVITKEQMAVILYRFAKNYEGRSYTPTSFSSISNHPDYSSVSPYAIEAVRWAKTFHVFPLTQASQYISPLAHMNRAYTALYIANYSREITSFITRDRFSFAHTGGTDSSSSFHSIYVLGYNAQQRLFSCIDNYYGSARTAAAERDKELIRSKIGSDFRGSCFGLTMSMYFDKLGKIDFNKNFGNNATSMSSVGLPRYNIATVESAINYYQFLHSIGDFYYQSYSYSFPAAMDLIYSYVNNFGATPIAYYWEGSEGTVGHAVLLTSITRNQNNSIYTLKVLDPNRSGEYPVERTFYLSGNKLFLANTANNNGGDTEIIQFNYYPKYSSDFLDNFDLDGNHNNQNYTMIASSAAAVVTDHLQESNISSSKSIVSSYNGETATICVPYTEFEIVNSAGETLYSNGRSLSGTMEILDTRLIPNGTSAPAELILTVENSSSFYYTNLSNSATYFCAISPNGFASASGDGISSVKADFSTSILRIYGENMTYSIWLETNIQDYEYFYIKGTNSVSFSLEVSNQKVISDGIVGTQECGFTDSETTTASTTTLTFAEESVLDLSNISDTGVVHFSTMPDCSSDTVFPVSTLSGKDDLNED